MLGPATNLKSTRLIPTPSAQGRDYKKLVSRPSSLIFTYEFKRTVYTRVLAAPVYKPHLLWMFKTYSLNSDPYIRRILI